MVCLLALGVQLTSAATAPLRVIFGVSRPPFVNEQNQSGISVELFREAARRMGVEFTAEFAPNKRMEYQLIQGTADAVVEVQNVTDQAFYSTPYITYTNVVLSWAKDNLKFRQWDDLAGREVCAWQMAESNLGPTFAAARSKFRSYVEFGAQRDQVRLWLLGRCKVLVIDRNMIFWHLAELHRNAPALHIPTEKEMDMTPVPGNADIDWYVGFKDSVLRDRFNQALGAMRKDGSYKRIVSRFLQDSQK